MVNDPPSLVGCLASAAAIAPPALKAHDGSAEHLNDVTSINLESVMKPTFGFRSDLQVADTPDPAMIECVVSLEKRDARKDASGSSPAELIW